MKKNILFGFCLLTVSVTGFTAEAMLKEGAPSEERKYYSSRSRFPNKILRATNPVLPENFSTLSRDKKLEALYKYHEAKAQKLIHETRMPFKTHSVDCSTQEEQKIGAYHVANAALAYENWKQKPYFITYTATGATVEDYSRVLFDLGTDPLIAATLEQAE